MRRRMHPFHRAANLFVGYSILFGGLVGGAYLLTIETHSDTLYETVIVVAAVILGSAWVYDDMLEGDDDPYPGWQDAPSIVPGDDIHHPDLPTDLMESEPRNHRDAPKELLGRRRI